MSVLQSFSSYVREFFGSDSSKKGSVATFDSETTEYRITSLGSGGFDEVTRNDIKSAEEAAEVHFKATGNECRIELIE